MWSRLGAEVTVVEYLDAIGSGMDSSTASALLKILQKQGLKFKLRTKVNSASKKGDHYVIEVEKDGRKEQVKSINILKR